MRRAAAAGAASVLGQALTSSSEVKLEAAELQDVHHIIARGHVFPSGLLAVSANVASKPYVQAAVLEALRADYMLVDVPGGAAIPVFREEWDGKEGDSVDEQQEGAQQQQQQPRLDEEGKQSESKQLSLSSSSSAPSALSSLRQRRGMNNQLAPIGGQQQEDVQSVPVAAQDQEAVFEQAEKRLRKWGNAWQPIADSQLSSISATASPLAQLSARSVQVDSVTPIDDSADVVTPLPPIELDSPRSAAVVSAPQPKAGMLEWLLQWLDSKISGILGVLVPASSSTSASAAAPSSSSHSSAVSYRLEASEACASSSSSAAASSAPASSSFSLSSPSSAVRGAQVVAGVAAVVIVLALVRRHSPAVFALVAKLLQG